FAENIDKRQLNPYGQSTADAQAFEQIVSRFQRYLQVTDPNQFGLLVHDNNQSVAKKHTEMMRSFHHSGTSFTDPITNIIETPLFVDSKLTRMVQIADLCAYALRRFHERGEADLFRLVFQRGDRQGTRVVGVRHFTGRLSCNCEICAAHNA
ncbi:MAG: DUF3800 domain-containing protein, partial [Rhodospirillales bacterium]|nr:DUF3800 domain-containing protein [Rhodospirillales bacterium]